MEEKKKGNGVLVALVIVLLLVCVGMGAFIFVNKEKLTGKNNTTINNENKNVNEETTKSIDISYDLKTSDYGLGDTGAGISVSVDNTRKSVNISYNGATISDTFNLGWFTAADKTTYEPIDTKKFDKKITQVLIDGVGQDATNTSIIYLMEDGTVEYVPILKEVKSENWQKENKTKLFNSYGQLKGISEVISLIPAEAQGYHTILARKVDGTVINLNDAFQKTGNFK